MFLTILVVALISVLSSIIAVYIRRLSKLRRYPKGPIPLPLIGNIHQIGSNPLDTFKQWAKQYGEVFSFSIGEHRIVVLNGEKSIHEALVTNGKVFGGRPYDGASKVFAKRLQNLSHTDYGPACTEIRKFLHVSLTSYKKETNGKERLILDECSRLCDSLTALEAVPTNVKTYLEECVFNTILRMAFGERLPRTDPHLHQMVSSVYKLLNNSSITDKANIISVFSMLPLKRWKDVEEANQFLNTWVKKKVNENVQTFDENNLRDLTDHLIKLFSSSKCFPTFNVDQVALLIIEMIVAGTETTLLTLSWSILYLLKHPELQTKLYNEIVSVVGEENVKYSDHTKCHQVQAFIQEVLRISSVVPLNLAHKATEESNICGHNIPKNTTVITNLYALHHDIKLFANPLTFDLNRWLDSDGKFIHKISKSFKVFSAGSRVCIGQAFAKMQLFLITSSLIKTFEFKTNKGISETEGDFGLTLKPNEFKVKCIPRKSN